MMDIKKAIKNDLEKLGIESKDTLLIHSSLKALSRERIEADLVIEALIEYFGQEGTVLLPALSYENVNRANPFFSVRNTPVCVGVLPEKFRLTSGVVRSVHPTHSVAAHGKYAQELAQEHYKDQSPVGPNSPFSLLPKYKGKILFIGDILNSNTSMHGVEEKVLPPYLFSEGRTLYTLELVDGSSIRTSHLSHNFAGYGQKYERILEYLDKDDYQKGQILEAQSYVLEAKAVWDKGYRALKEDPLCFVELL